MIACAANTILMHMFIVCSTWLILLRTPPAFFITFVSRPVYTTRPSIHRVLRSVQPRSTMLRAPTGA